MKSQCYYEPQRDLEQSISHILLYNVTTDLHFHDSIEILYVKKGKIFYTSNSQSKTLSAGEAVFIPPSNIHQFYTLKPSVTETVIIPSRYLKDFLSYCSNQFFLHLDNIEVNKRLAQLFTEIESLKDILSDHPLLAQGIVNHLLGYIASQYPFSPYEKQETLIFNIAQYINNNFQQNITLKDVAIHFGYNTSYFSRMFNKFFLCSFSDYLNNTRYLYIKKNKKSNNITSLIYEAGFSSTSSYYRYLQKRKSSTSLN